ncbi:MAG: 30S ribosomal protein S11 [Candidatus Coatesbacteria bacterium]|nr:30S ribosomal protein S11 [Candidatus Coatesbacteria bacterium]
MAKGVKKKGRRVAKRKEKRVVPEGVIHIQSTFNNTIISVTDKYGNVIAWASSGKMGFKGSRKGTPFAAQVAARTAAQAAVGMGMRRAELYVKGPGSGRDTAMKALQSEGIEVTLMRDVTPIPHDGCRPPKRRRV